jgi:hypothetical protein
MARYSDDEVSASITKRIQDLPPGAGLTAVELAGAIQISVALAQDQLLVMYLSNTTLSFCEFARRELGHPQLTYTHTLFFLLFSLLADTKKKMTEARGLICRDEAIEGLRFYDNLFAKWEI